MSRERRRAHKVEHNRDDVHLRKKAQSGAEALGWISSAEGRGDAEERCSEKRSPSAETEGTCLHAISAHSRRTETGTNMRRPGQPVRTVSSTGGLSVCLSFSRHASPKAAGGSPRTDVVIDRPAPLDGLHDALEVVVHQNDVRRLLGDRRALRSAAAAAAGGAASGASGCAAIE